jgi:hypothetical protein
MASPARFDYARDFALEREETEANATELEVAVIAPRATTNLAPSLVAGRKLGSFVELRELTGTSHLIASQTILRCRILFYFGSHARKGMPS